MGGGRIEHCQICGQPYETVYRVPDWIWKRITPKLRDAEYDIDFATGGMGIEGLWKPGDLDD